MIHDRYADEAIGAVLGLCILLLRHRVPESPRWLMTHGWNEEAEDIVGDTGAKVVDRPERLPGTPIGGTRAPALFDALIESGSRTALFWGYVGSGVLMIGAAMVEAFIGVEAVGQSRESISKPLAAR